MDLRMTCLAESLAELRAVVDLLAGADAQVAERAVRVATGLRPLSRCADTATLTAGAAVSPATAAAVRDLDTLLVQVRAEHDAGRYARGLQLARDAVVAAGRIGHDPTRAEALHHRGMLEEDAGDFTAAERSYEAAYWLGEAVGEDRVRVAAAIALTELVGERLGRDHDSVQWGRHAGALLQRLGDPPVLEAQLRAALGVVHNRYGRYDEAQRALERAIALTEASDPRLATFYRQLGNVHYRRGHYPDAQTAHERAVELGEAALGPDHPDVGRAISNLGESHRCQGHIDEAERCFRRSIEIWEQAFGPEHSLLAPPYNGLGTLALLRGDTRAAVAHYERVLSLLAGSYGPDHPDVGGITSNLGEVLLAEGSLAESRRYSERALEIFERSLGPEHDGLADVLCNLGRVLVLQGELTRAAEHYARALALLERSHDAGFAGLAKPLVGQGLLALAAGRPAAALPLLERALALGIADTAKLAEARLALARALWDARVDRHRARALAEQARDELATTGAVASRARIGAELGEWLAAHPLP
jgi:tetratricopeptide (TPR) repeat protein